MFSILALIPLLLLSNAASLLAAVAPPPEQTELPLKTDSDISSAIRAAFTADQFLSEKTFGIAVLVENGTVTLTGTVATEGDKASIGGKAKSVGGVRNVINEIEVQKIK